MKMSNVKLVIWDMDETFWKGTLSEGGVKKIERNVEIVKKLVDRGIMCSISSKNNFDDVKSVLTEWGVWDCFIFPQISWEPKGEQVKALLEQCSLRAVNTLFIDDNISNLKEVAFYNLGIMTTLPDILRDDFLDIPELKGKDDKSHSRLNQYKVLEKKYEKEKTFASNEDFLRASHIKIVIDTNCEQNVERIVELIQRSNQLNYTKVRSQSDEINQLLTDDNTQCACISVFDDFGEYGIIGFYALKDKELIHFVFSCRTIGFGIENYLYKKLGYPNIAIQGEVSIALDKEYAEKINWIEEIDVSKESNEANETKNQGKILMIGGCDLDQACAYLDSKLAIDKEFNTIVNGHEIRTSDTSQIINKLTLNQKEKEELCLNIPFFDKDITFATKAFSGEYDIIIISVIDDYIRGIWKNKEKNYEIGYGGYFDQELMLSRFNETELRYLKDKFEYLGREKEEVFENNLRTIINKIGSGHRIVLLNGVDLDVSEWIGEDRVKRNTEMNAIVDAVVTDYDNVDLIDIRNIVTDKNQLPQKDNRHLDRKSYYRIAEEILKYCQQYYGNNDGKIRSIASIRAKVFVAKVVNKMKKLIGVNL